MSSASAIQSSGRNCGLAIIPFSSRRMYVVLTPTMFARSRMDKPALTRLARNSLPKTPTIWAPNLHVGTFEALLAPTTCDACGTIHPR